jgi:hypothetical protein
MCCSGGLDLLFGDQKTVEAEIPPQDGGQVRWGALVNSRAAPAGSGASAGGNGPPPSLTAPPCVLLCLQLTVAEAMAWARDNLLTERPELFMKGSSV